MYPEDYLYSTEHEWVRREGEDLCVIGVTHYAQDELGDVVFVELPEPGESVEANAEIGSIESVKAVAEIYSPVTGEVVESNSALDERPELINQDPHGEGWIAKLRITNPEELQELMSAGEYREYLESGG